MSDHSKKWDKRKERVKRPIIFNWKVIIFLGIVILLVSLMIGMAFPPIYAEHSGCHDIEEGFDILKILCYVVDIWYQNERIIEKLDWNNCVILNKEAKDYDAGYWGFNVQLPSDLMDECGDMP